jgi:monoterpene epsilon-lactone hydrolase
MHAEIRQKATTHGAWCVIHPFSPEDSVAMTALRSAVAGMKGKLEGTAARGPFNGIMERVAAPGGVSFEAAAVGGISGWWARPAQARKRAAILHLHGGWFNWGTAQAFRNLVGHIALSAGGMRSHPTISWLLNTRSPPQSGTRSPAIADSLTGE